MGKRESRNMHCARRCCKKRSYLWNSNENKVTVNQKKALPLTRIVGAEAVQPAGPLLGQHAVLVREGEQAVEQRAAGERQTMERWQQIRYQGSKDAGMYSKMRDQKFKYILSTTCIQSNIFTRFEIAIV